MAIDLRLENERDHEAVRHVNRVAFGQEAEATLVEALRAGGFARVSLVADQDGQIVGHILFSEMSIVAATGSVSALALAPMAVLPAWQRQGIGSALVRAGLALCKEQGHRIVLVVGHPQFYPRFGFSAALAAQLTSPYAGEAFLAAELARRER